MAMCILCQYFYHILRSRTYRKDQFSTRFERMLDRLKIRSIPVAFSFSPPKATHALLPFFQSFFDFSSLMQFELSKSKIMLPPSDPGARATRQFVRII